MNQIKIIWNKKASGYLPEKLTDNNLAILCFFLIDDVGYYAINMLRGWMDDPCATQNSSNYSYQKKNGDKIQINNLMNWGQAKEEVFEITADALHTLLDHWEKLCKQRPNEVIIIKDNDTIMLEGKK